MVKKCITADCIIIHQNKVLLLKHKKLGVWLTPGGHVEDNETPIETALRETKEEAGIDVEIMDALFRKNLKKSKEAHETPQPLSILYETVSFKDGSVHMHFDLIYLAKPTNATKAQNNQESEGIGWFSEGEIEGLNTYENVKDTVRKGFETMRTK